MSMLVGRALKTFLFIDLKSPSTLSRCYYQIYQFWWNQINFILLYISKMLNKCWRPPFLTGFLLFFALFYTFFFTLKYAKSCFSVKKLISTREWRGEHPFAGRNTQQLTTIRPHTFQRPFLVWACGILFQLSVWQWFCFNL